MYKCTCLDSALCAVICKHIHLVHCQQDISGASNESQDNSDDFNSSEQSGIHPLQQFHGDESAHTKKTAMEKAMLLKDMIEGCNDSVAIAAVSGHLSSAISVIKASGEYQTSELRISQRPAANAKNVVQRRFVSTKKKPSRSTCTLAKPTELDIIRAEKVLLSTDISVCGLCFQVDDCLVARTP